MTGRGGVKMQSTTGNPMYALRDVLGKGKGLRKDLQGHANSFRTVNSYGYLSASKLMPLANTSDEPSSLCTISTHIGMLPSSISGSFEQTPSLLKPTEVKEESSSKHAASTTPAIITHRRSGTGTSNDARSMRWETFTKAKRSRYTTQASTRTAKPETRLFLAFFCNMLPLPILVLQHCARQSSLVGSLPELRHKRRRSPIMNETVKLTRRPDPQSTRSWLFWCFLPFLSLSFI